MRVKGAELATEAREYFLDGTLSAQGYLALGQATGMGNLLEAHVDDQESQARVDAAVKDGKPIVSGTQNLWGNTLGALPAVDPLKRREDQKLIAEARNTKRSIKVTLRNGKVLRHELPSVTVKKLEAMRAESEAYLDRNFYDPDKYNLDRTGKRYLRPELLQNLPGQEVPKDFPFPGSVLTEEQMARISNPKATPSTNEEIPYLLRMMGLTNQMSDIKRIEVETPEKALRPILERMREEAAPIEAELDKYLDKFDLNPEERAVARYRIIADATRSIPVGLWEMVSSGERMSEKLPYAGGFIAIANMWHIGSIANRVAKGEKVSDADMAVLEHALLDMERDESRAAAIVSGALDILSLGVEVGTSGGIVSLGRKGGTEAAELAMREGLERMGTAEARKALRGMMARRALTTGLEIAVQTAGPSAHRWAKAAYEDAFIKGVHPYQGPDGEYYAQLDAGHQRGSFWEAAPKAIAHGLVDNISERTGGLLLKWPGAQEAFAKMGAKAREELAKRAMLQLAIEKVGANKAVQFLSRSHEKLGMHGMHREYLEEVDAAFGHALVDGEAPRFMGTDDVINMMASMVLARAMMGGGGERNDEAAAGASTTATAPGAPTSGVTNSPATGAASTLTGLDADIWKPVTGGGIYGEEEGGDAKKQDRVSFSGANASRGGADAKVLAETFQSLATDETFRRGPAVADKDLNTIMQTMASRVDKPEHVSIERISPMFSETAESYSVTINHGGSVVVNVETNGTVWVDTQGVRGGEPSKKVQGGDLIYQAVQTYAHNNGLVFVPDPRSVSDAAQRRRISHMISSALRHRTTRHLQPYHDKERYNKLLPKRDEWREEKTEADFLNNLDLLLRAEMNYVAKGMEGKFENLRYDPDTDTVWQKQGGIDGGPSDWRQLSRRDYETSVAGLDPGRSGIGETTLARALLAKVRLEEQESGINRDQYFRGPTPHGGGISAAQSGSEVFRLLGPSASPQELFYSRGESSGSERVQRTGVTRAETDDAEFRLKRTAQGRAIYGNVLIVDNRDALDGLQGRPAKQRYHAEDWDIMQDSEGFHDPRDGTVVVFRENVRVLEGETAAQALARVVVHERVGHHGFDALRSSDSKFAEEWKKLAAAIPADQMKALEARYTHLNGNRDALALEWFAHQVGNMEGRVLLEPGSVAQRMWQALRDWVVRQFNPLGDPSRPMSQEVIDAHVRGLIRATRRGMVKNGIDQQRRSQQPQNTESLDSSPSASPFSSVAFSLNEDDNPNDVRSQTGSRSDPRSSLELAESHIASSVYPNGTRDEEDWDSPEKEWNSLRTWAKESQLILPSHFPRPEKEGGHEHDVRFDEATGRWWKYTKANACGYTTAWYEGSPPFMLPASPLDYIERLRWYNEHFADDVRLEGLWQDQNRAWHIVTTQPNMVGEAPTFEQLKESMSRLGWELLPWKDIGHYNALAFKKGDYAVWDVHPGNAIINAAGIVVPIDFIITKPGPRAFGASVGEGGL